MPEVQKRARWPKEDASRLVYDVGPDSSRVIYEPLVVALESGHAAEISVITEEHLRPYCWGYARVMFCDAIRGIPGGRKDALYEAYHLLDHGDVVESCGARWELTGATCVYAYGQWCMRWWTHRTDKPVWPDAGELDRRRRLHAESFASDLSFTASRASVGVPR